MILTPAPLNTPRRKENNKTIPTHPTPSTIHPHSPLCVFASLREPLHHPPNIHPLPPLRLGVFA